MTQFHIHLLLILAVFDAGCSGFVVMPRPATRTITVVKGSSMALPDHEDELSYIQMLSKARECAYSDSDSPSEAVKAQRFLEEIFHMEGLCAGGVVAGEVCENVDEVAMLVARLREKVRAGYSDAGAVFSDNRVGGAELSLADRILTVVSSSAALFFLVIGASLLLEVNKGATPLVLQEWIWAAKDGYLGDMMYHFIRNGGL